MNRRVFLGRIIIYAGLYTFPVTICGSLWRGTLFAQTNAPAAPGFGGFNANEKRVYESEIVNRANELTDKWDENAAEHVIELSPEQKERQREEIEKAMRNMVESKGYEISAPMNLRIIN